MGAGSKRACESLGGAVSDHRLLTYGYRKGKEVRTGKELKDRKGGKGKKMR